MRLPEFHAPPPNLHSTTSPPRSIYHSYHGKSLKPHGKYEDILLRSLHTKTFPQPFDALGAQWHGARPITARQPWPRRWMAWEMEAIGSQQARPGELQSSCMICASPPAPPPSHHHHSLYHPSIYIHPHCQPSCFRYYHFLRRHILFSASNQSLPKTATPPIARPPSRHSLCSPYYQTLSRLQTGLLRIASAQYH